jgi:hypothetical protein
MRVVIGLAELLPTRSSFHLQMTQTQQQLWQSGNRATWQFGLGFARLPVGPFERVIRRFTE